MGQFRALRQFAYKVARRFAEDRCSRVAGALSFTTLLALVPLTAVMFAVLSVLPVFESWMSSVQAFLYGNFLPTTGEAVSRYLRQFAANAGRLTVWGLIFLVVASLMVMATIERVFNDIWHVPHNRKRLHRYLAYGVLLVLAPVLIGISLSVTSSLIALPLFSGRSYLSPLRMFLLGAVPVGFEWLAFMLLYAVAPNHPVRWRHALIGSFLATVLFEIAKRGFGYFVLHFTSYKAIYGAVAALPVFLIWIYLSWTVILLGAVVAATLPEWNRPQAVRQWRRRRQS